MKDVLMTRRWLVLIVVLGVGAVLAAAYQAWCTANRGGRPESDAVRDDSSAEPKSHVSLTEAKWAAARIVVAPVERRTLQPTRTVPGRIDYNGTRHVAVKSPVEGLVRKMAVLVGASVEEGQVLAIIDSPELGERRADVLKQQADLELARRERDWWQELHSNLDELLARLKRPQEIAVLERDFADKPLGDYRRDIFSAYSKYRTADTITANLMSLAEGSVSTRTVLEQRAARDAASADFQASAEQVAFDSKQKLGKAVAVFEDASRRLGVAIERLTWLTGQPGEVPHDPEKVGSLSTWPVKAPFAATVEEVMLAATERVRHGDDILLLADTTTMWVQADIREKDWSALSLSAGQTIQVQTPALPGKTLDATIAFVGRAVNSETRAAPIVADIRNDEHLLKPGLFVRVLLPDGTPYESLAIPDSALVRHEGRTFVFAEVGPREFEARDVVVGLSIDPWVAITSGLNAGDRIATSGTFVLKSELLLEPDE
jgi:membrane fusion protein, heavy metal efflux system